MNMQALLKQAQKMQKDLAKAELELKEKEYEASMSGGAVKVIVKGSMEVTQVEIDSDLLKSDNKEELQDMIMIAINDALKQASEEKEKVMKNMTGGVKMPGGF